MKRFCKPLFLLAIVFHCAQQASAVTVGVLAADGTLSANSAIRQLVNTGLFASEDIINLNRNTSNLNNYDVVLSWTDEAWEHPDQTGDAMADYIDNGGGLVLAVYSFSIDWGIKGRIVQDGYSPYKPVEPGSGSPFSGELDTDSYADHPIFNGLSGVSYWENYNYTDPVLSPSATELAADTNGNSVVAINQAGNIIGINIYPALMGPDAARLFANSLYHLAGETPVPLPGAIWFLGLGLIGIAAKKK